MTAIARKVRVYGELLVCMIVWIVLHVCTIGVIRKQSVWNQYAFSYNIVIYNKGSLLIKRLRMFSTGFLRI